MKFDYTFLKKDFIFFLKESNKKYNYICLIIFTLFYFGACLDLVSTNATAVFLSYIISILILFSILKLITALFVKIMVKRNDKVLEFAYGTYKIEINSDELKETLNDKIFSLKYQDIYRVSKTDKWLILYPKDGKIMYLFLKKLFPKEENYHKCVNMILNHYQKAKTNEEKDVKSTSISTNKKKEKNLKETRKKSSKKKAK